MSKINGAAAIIGSLEQAGVEFCFANPGTSEMHLVEALGNAKNMRSVLTLFEGVATGAADGYGRMAGKPAATLLHLGPGLSNGLANIHNAWRAYTPMLNLIGDHATWHAQADAALSSDIVSLARPNHVWTAFAQSGSEAPGLAVHGVLEAQFGQPPGPVCLTLPSDCCWAENIQSANSLKPSAVKEINIDPFAKLLKKAKRPLILLGDRAAREPALSWAGQLKAAGYRVMTETFVARQRRGAGYFSPERLYYFAEMAVADLAQHDLVLRFGARDPVAFFGYEGQPSALLPSHCKSWEVVPVGQNPAPALEALCEAVGAKEKAELAALQIADTAPTGALSFETVAQSLARHMPANAIIVDDGVTGSLHAFLSTITARPHDWLMLTGGAIGWGLPGGLGASHACPDRKVISLNGDGASLYSLQALWSWAREGIDATAIIFANRRYDILGMEYQRVVGTDPSVKAQQMIDISGPDIDFTGLAKSFGVEAHRCVTADEFDRTLANCLVDTGPKLIEVISA